MRTQLLLGVLIDISIAVLPTVAKDKKPGKEKPGAETPAPPPGPGVKTEFVFTTQERQVIQTFVAGHSAPPGKGKRAKPLPPGLAKKVARGGKLPPGWEKKVAVGVIMAPEVYKECKPLPPELVVKLPPSPAGTITVAVQGKVARLLGATLEILDVFDALP